jgi:hypothetical protein
MMRRFRKLLAVLAFALVGANTHAATLNGNLTADDLFSAYISTDDSTLGTLIGSGTPWFTTFPLIPTALAPGVTHYLHIIATDNGGPEMFVGDFSLSDTTFQFANGTQSLLTNTTNWRAAEAGNPAVWVAPGAAPVSLGVNSAGATWSGRTGISGSAEFIWSTGGDGGGETAFFSTTITSLTAPIPEPSTYALMLAGLGFVGFVANRRRRAQTAV